MPERIEKRCGGSRELPEAICLDYPQYAKPRGICPSCRDDFAVLGDGTLSNHKADRPWTTPRWSEMSWKT